ncbi:MAG: HlyD family efflux transporter periplasmic adaptor subunit [Chloroflexi bacterium]|nr:HlyD family efflux transporter periplasmic adaptor subunit [Chloroflexota bacterium]
MVTDGRLARRFLLMVLAVLSILSIALEGCAVVRPGRNQAQLVPTPIPTPSGSNRPTTVVQRGAVIQTIKGTGRIQSQEEATLYFTQSARLRRRYVDVNDAVKAGALLAEIDTADLRKQINEQTIQVSIAELRLAQVIEKSSAAADLAGATAALARAEADYRRALRDLEVLQSGPTEADVAAASQQLAVAQARLTQAENDPARRSGPTESELRAAELEVARQRALLWGEQGARDAICGSDRGPACEAVEARLLNFHANVRAAEEALARLKVGAPAGDREVADWNVESARAAVKAAETRLVEIKAGPKAQDVLAAMKMVESAQAGTQAARAAYDRQVAQASQGETNILIERKNVELVRLALGELERQLGAAILKAPFDGLVTQSEGREGDVLPAFKPAVTVANPKAYRLAIDVSANDAAKLALGQQATVVLAALPTEKYEGKVVKVPTLLASTDVQGGRGRGGTVHIDFKMPRAPELGALANVAIAVQKKEDILVVPSRFIRVQGTRRFVRLAETGRRLPEVDVEVGIADEENTEIVRGLTEGQRVVQP